MPVCDECGRTHPLRFECSEHHANGCPVGRALWNRGDRAEQLRYEQEVRREW